MGEHPIAAAIRVKLSDPARPFSLVVDLRAQPGRGDALEHAIEKCRIVRLSRAEPGCLGYDIGRDTESPDAFVVYECWRDLGALEKHLATRHFGDLGAAMEGLLVSPPALRVLTPAGGT